MLLNFDPLSASRRYHTMIQTLIPRPVAWVLSDNGDNSLNLAPFSYFAPVCSDPALLMISIGKKPDGSLKDTRRNILERKHFVVHIASALMAQKVTQSSATLAFGDSELVHCGLETNSFEPFSLPRLADCSVAYGCDFYDVKEFGDLPQAVLFGRVRWLYLDDAIVQEEDGRLAVAAEKIDPLARLGGDQYWVKGQVVDISRPR